MLHLEEFVQESPSNPEKRRNGGSDNMEDIHTFFSIRDVAKFPVLLSLKFSSFSSAAVPYSSLIFFEDLRIGVS